MTEIWLIGCFHNDPNGQKLLRSMLNNIKPELITVEISKYSIKFRRDRGPHLRAKVEEAFLEISKERKMLGAEILNHPYIYALWKNLFMPYEYAEALRYAESHQAKIFPVDIATPAKEYLKELEKAATQENIRMLFGLDPSQFHAELEGARRQAFQSLETCCTDNPEDSEDSRRDSYMASRIRKLIALHKPHTAAHIGGWQHVLPGRPLYKKLKNLRPKAILL